MVVQMFLALLSASSLFDSLLAGTPVAGWKQIIVITAWLMCFGYVKSVAAYWMIFLCAALIVVLMFASLAQGVSLQSALFNAFFYDSWVPFFILSANSEWKSGERWGGRWLLFLVLSAIGLMVDLHTDLFSFLRTENVDRAYLDEHSVAKRAAFLFNTSTTVMPIVSAMSVLAFLRKPRVPTVSVIAISLVVAAISTGSLSGAGIATIFLLSLVFATARGNVFRAVFLASSMLLVAGLAAEMTTDLIDLQIERVLNNTDSESEGNLGRAYQFKEAADVIADKTIQQHLLGNGLGTTNDRFGITALYPHGESSLLQAYIEAGIIGLALRVLPFGMALYYFIRSRGQRRFILGGYFLSTAAATALAPTFGFLPLQAWLGFLLGGLAQEASRVGRYSRSGQLAIDSAPQ